MSFQVLSPQPPAQPLESFRETTADPIKVRSTAHQCHPSESQPPEEEEEQRGAGSGQERPGHRPAWLVQGWGRGWGPRFSGSTRTLREELLPGDPGSMLVPEEEGPGMPGKPPHPPKDSWPPEPLVPPSSRK